MASVLPTTTFRDQLSGCHRNSYNVYATQTYLAPTAVCDKASTHWFCSSHKTTLDQSKHVKPRGTCVQTKLTVRIVVILISWFQILFRPNFPGVAQPHRRNNGCGRSIRHLVECNKLPNSVPTSSMVNSCISLNKSRTQRVISQATAWYPSPMRCIRCV